MLEVQSKMITTGGSCTETIAECKLCASMALYKVFDEAQ
jgi:hypothetical protein